MKPWFAGLAIALLIGCNTLPEVNSKPRSTTQYGEGDVEFRGAKVSKYSDAERRHLFVYHFDAPPEVIFEDVARLEGFAPVRWDDNGTGTEGPGKGTIRWVSVAGGDYDYTSSPLSRLKKPIFNKAIPDGLDGLVEIHVGTRLEPSDHLPG